MPKVSLITSCYKGNRWLDGFFENLAAQQETDAEVIFFNVHDDPDSSQKLHSLCPFPCKELYSRRRIGLYDAWNQCVQVAEGEYILVANVDDKLFPGAIARLVGALDEHDNVDLVYGSGYYTRHKDATMENPLAFGRLPARPFDPAALWRGCYIHPHPMWRARLHGEVGLFNNMFWSAGDFEFFMRLVEAGKGFAYIQSDISLMYKADDTLGNSQMGRSATEAGLVRQRYIRH